MNINSKRLRIYILLMLVVGAVSSALRTIACLFDLNYDIGHFENGALASAASIVLWIGVIIMFSYLLISTGVNLRPSFTSPLSYVPTGIISVALLFIGAKLLLDCDYSGLRSAFAELSRAIGIKNIFLCVLDLLGAAMPILLALLALASTIHLFLGGYLTSEESVTRGYFALGTVLFLAIYVTYLHLQNGVQINAPNKLADQMAYLFSALFFLYEARISLGREKWGLYASFGLAAAMLCLFSSVPSLMTFAVRGELISASLEESLVTLSLFIFITTRLVVTSLLPDKKENELIARLRAYAEEREGVEDDGTSERSPYDEQMNLDLEIAAAIFTTKSEEEIEEERLHLLAEQMADPEEDIDISECEECPPVIEEASDDDSQQTIEIGDTEPRAEEQTSTEYDIFEEVMPSRFDKGIHINTPTNKD